MAVSPFLRVRRGSEAMPRTPGPTSRAVLYFRVSYNSHNQGFLVGNSPGCPGERLVWSHGLRSLRRAEEGLSLQHLGFARGVMALQSSASLLVPDLFCCIWSVSSWHQCLGVSACSFLSTDAGKSSAELGGVGEHRLATCERLGETQRALRGKGRGHVEQLLCGTDREKSSSAQPWEKAGEEGGVFWASSLLSCSAQTILLLRFPPLSGDGRKRRLSHQRWLRNPAPNCAVG